MKTKIMFFGGWVGWKAILETADSSPKSKSNKVDFIIFACSSLKNQSFGFIAVFAICGRHRNCIRVDLPIYQYTS